MSDREERLSAEAEALLVERARRGHREATDRLLALHQDRVFRTALGLLGGDREGAAEVTQQVLISAYQHLGQFRGDARFATWLHRMTINHARNHQTAQGRQRARLVSLDAPGGSAGEEEAPAGGPAARLPHGGPSPRQAASHAEALARLHTAIGALPEEYREPVVLRFLDDLSYDEIAALLGVPPGTVKSRISRGRAELRRMLGDLLDGEAP